MSMLPAALRRTLPLAQQLDLVCSSGKPFGLVSVRLVQEDGSLVTPASRGAAVGGVWIRGPTVFPGYWRHPEADTERRGGWFPTGDLATLSAWGFLTVVDRAKDMVLCGGENVYSSEVENVLAAHSAVLSCAVFGLPHALMGETVTAAVCLREGAEVERAELLRFCAASLSGALRSLLVGAVAQRQAARLLAADAER